MKDKKNPFGYLLAGLVGAAAGAVAMLGFSRQIPKMMAKCCGGPEAKKATVKKRKK